MHIWMYRSTVATLKTHNWSAIIIMKIIKCHKVTKLTNKFMSLWMIVDAFLVLGDRWGKFNKAWLVFVLKGVGLDFRIDLPNFLTYFARREEL